MKMHKLDIDRSVTAYRGLTGVKFSHPDFIKQLDPNILNAVMILNSKGFVTVASCQGHGIIEYMFTDRKNFVFTGPHIVIQSNNIDQYEYIIKSFNTLLIKTIKEDNKTIWIQPRFIKYFLPNNYLCDKITEICNNLKII
jgi:hypothetical protein